MAVTVEELQIVVVANVKNAMAQMTQLNRQIKKTMTDAVKPVKQVTESAQKSASVIAKAQAQIAEANARTQVAQDKMRASAAKTQAAIEKASAASAKAQESLRKSTEAANAAMERQRKATARVKQTREELAKIVDRALQPQANNDMVESDGPLYPPKPYTDAYAPKKAAQPQQPRAPSVESLTVWQRVTAQINAKLDALKEKLHKVGLYGKDAGEKTEKALKKVRAPAENAARAVKKVGDSARKSSAHAGYLGRMLKSMAVSMLFFQGIALVTSAVRDGIQNMAQGSTRANAVLSSLASSFLYLKNSIASAFMPALQALAPVIATITNALASMLNMIGAVTARLFGGATTFVKAKKVQTDYAASISKTGQAAKKAAKDAQGALASFDELNVIEQEKTADAGDAAIGVAQPADMFETVAISPEALSFADKVAGMFNRLKTAAEPTIEAFGRLKTAMQPLKEFTFTALTDFYKNFLVPVGKWTLGEGLPRFIDALSNGLGKVNWGNINTALKTLWEALTPFTIHVGEGLLWFWENVLVPLGTWTMNEIVPRFLEGLSYIIQTLDGIIKLAAPSLRWLWNSFLSPLAQWTGGVITDVLDTVVGLLKNLAGLLNGDVKQASDGAKEFFAGLGHIIEDVFVAILGTDAVTAIKNFVLEWITRIASWWTNDVTPWFTLDKWKTLFNTIKIGLAEKWSEVVSWWAGSGASKWIQTNVKPLFAVDTWKGYYDSVKSALSSVWGKAVSWWSADGGGKWIDECVKPLFRLETWQGYYENVATALKSTFKNGINGAIELVNQFVRWLNEKMKFSWDALVIAGKEIIPAGSIQLFTVPELPKLASGGVLRAETAFVGGEYAGASSNPEIVSPQSIMLETFKEAVWPLVDAILEGDEKVKSAIEAKDTNMYVDGYKMNRTLAAHDSRVSKQRGESLIL